MKTDLEDSPHCHTLPAEPAPLELVTRAEDEPPLAWHAFVRAVGVSTVTAWRWRKAGFIDVVNITGKPYVARAEIRRFNARLASGEFSRPSRAPLRNRGGVQ